MSKTRKRANCPAWPRCACVVRGRKDVDCQEPLSERRTLLQELRDARLALTQERARVRELERLAKVGLNHMEEMYKNAQEAADNDFDYLLPEIERGRAAMKDELAREQEKSKP